MRKQYMVFDLVNDNNHWSALRDSEVCATTQDIPGIPKLPIELFMKPYYVAFEYYDSVSGGLSFRSFIDRANNDPEFKMIWFKDWELMDAMHWAAKQQTAIIQRGFWSEPKAFDKKGKVISEAEYKRREMKEKYSNIGETSYSDAGNYAGHYGDTLPDFQEYMKSLEKPYIQIVLEMNTHHSNKYADWTIVVEDGFVKPIRMHKQK